MHFPGEGDRLAITRLLLDAMADASVKDANGLNALTSAMRRNRVAWSVPTYLRCEALRATVTS